MASPTRAGDYIVKSGSLVGGGDAVTREFSAMSDSPPASRGTLTQFTCFQELPVELRLTIWEMTFVAQIIDMTMGPRIRARRPSALLNLVNKEAHGVFLSNYTRCFRGDDSEPHCLRRSRGVLINFKLDALAIYGTGRLFQILNTHPEQMGWLQWLDIHLMAPLPFKYSPKHDMSLLHSLRLVTLCKRPSKRPVGPLEMMFVSRILDIFDGPRKPEGTKLPPNAKLALFLAPHHFEKDGMDDFKRTMSMAGRKFEQPSTMTYNRWSDTKLSSCGKTWPAAPDQFEAEGWFAYEVSRKPMDLQR